MAATSLEAEMTAVGLQNNLSYSKSDTKNREFYFVFLSACTTFAIKNNEVLKKTSSDILKILFSLILGGAILYWMYRGFDFAQLGDVMLHQMDWTWMLLSLPFGILAQAFRGWRWKLALDPLGEHPRNSTSVNSVFLSYALSLLIPRIGEFTRCGVLKRYDGVSFAKALGTVLTERVIDTLFIGLLILATFLYQFPIFHTFFNQTGTRLDTMLCQFSTTGYIVTAICGVVAIISTLALLRQYTIYNKVKNTISDMWAGITSLRMMDRRVLFIIYTLAIWGCYFLHYYLSFFCFDATSHLGISCALVTFVVGSVAVIVPTPNGAGPWHFAVKTMLILYGVTDTDALYFVLIVHSVQTLLVVLIGVYAWIALMFTRRRIIVQST